MKIINRIFFRLYQFYSKIEEDKGMIFYFSAFAFSFLVAFYVLFLIALVYLITGIKLIIISGWSLTVLFFIVIGISSLFLYKERPLLLKNIQSLQANYVFEDLIVGAFIIFGIASLFVGGMILY